MADPDLQIREGGGHPDPEIRGGGGAGLPKFFWPFGPQFGLKIQLYEAGGGGEGRAPHTPPLDPPVTSIGGWNVRVSLSLSLLQLSA